MWRAGWSSEAAFTLLEVIVVLIVLSLVGTAAALGVPNARDRVRLAQAESWLQSMLADLRGQARRQGRTIRVEFDMAAQRYRRSGAEWRSLPSDVTWSLEADARGQAPHAVLTFLPDGTGSAAAIRAKVGAYASIHRIEWLTGAVTHVRFP